MNNFERLGMQRVIIALGANLGDPKAQLEKALAVLEARFPGGFGASRVYRTAPVGMSDEAGDFANAVATFETDLTPQAMLAELQELEQASGRPQSHLKNTSRTLDLDLIAHGDVIMTTPKLTLPHPRASQRRFVLVPLLEIASDYRFPGQTLDVGALIDSAPFIDISLWH